MRRLGICLLLAALGGLLGWGCVMDDENDRKSCIDPVTLSVGPCRDKAERSGSQGGTRVPVSMVRMVAWSHDGPQ